MVRAPKHSPLALDVYIRQLGGHVLDGTLIAAHALADRIIEGQRPLQDLACRAQAALARAGRWAF